MDNKLKNLIEILREAELFTEAVELNELLKKSANVVDQDIALWEAVITEIDKPYDMQPQGRAIKYMIDAVSNINDANEGLKGASEEEIVQAFEAVKSASKNFNLNLIKKGGFGGFLSKTVPMISLLIAIKNIYYCFQEYKKIQADAPKIGLNWMDTLWTPKLELKAKELSGSPEELLILAKLTKSSKLFADEAISGLVNAIDGAKDLAFVIPNVATLGVSSWVDFGISMWLWLAVEVPAESFSNSKYNGVLAGVRGTAEVSIKSLIQQKNTEDLSLEEEESFEEWWSNLLA